MADSERPLVSVVVVTHGRPQLLGECLQSIAAQTWAHRELVVLLNPADDRSEAAAAPFAPRLLRTHRNLSAFPALNIAIANTTGSLIMVVDDDATFDDRDGLARLVGFLLENPQVMAVTCNIRGPAEPLWYRETRPVPAFKAGFTLYRRDIFGDIAGYIPDLLLRDGAESYMANCVYQNGGVIAVKHDVTMHHWQTPQGRRARAVNFSAVRSHALLAVLQEPWAMVPLSLGAKLGTTLLRVAVQRRDPAAWAAGWLSFVGNLAMAVRQRRPISLRTYLQLQALRRQAAASADVGRPGDPPACAEPTPDPAGLRS